MSLAHPLAQRLSAYLQDRPGSRVLDFAAGSGRNTAALRAAGFDVVSIDDRRAESSAPLSASGAPFAAAVSTHGLLHGGPQRIGAALAAIADRLEHDGRLYATFGSTRDARCGAGAKLGDWTFAPNDGPERGVPHTFYDRSRLDALLAPRFAVESLEECDVDGLAGSWAHQDRPLYDAVHWFVVARKR